MVGHIHRHINRDGERNTHKPAAAAVNLRIDADHLPFQVKQRPTRIAGVDGDVGLDERRIVFVRQAAALGGHDAGGDAVVEAERCADGRHPFARFQIFRIADFDHGQVFGVDFNQGDVGLLVGTD